MPTHPLAEVFGYPTDNTSPQAATARAQCLCPFCNKTCTKDKKDAPLGVCSVFEGTKIVITCPYRFRQNWTIAKDAAQFFFPDYPRWAKLEEVRLKDAYNESAGNIDVVITKLDTRGKVIDFGSLEIQAVYISGNVRDPFEAYMANPITNFVWHGPNYPRPDYLSSSRKRLAPQLQFKGGILNHWGKKMAVALDEHFYSTLPAMPEVSATEGEVAWFVYGLRLNADTNTYVLQRQRTVYTKFAEALAVISTPEPGQVTEFIARLQTKLDANGTALPLWGES